MGLALLLARLTLALVLGVAALAKLRDPSGSRSAIVGFGVPGGLAPALALAVPVAELAVASLLVPVATAAWAAVAGFVLLAVFTGAIAVNLKKGRTPDCHCFGVLSSRPVGTGTLVRNAVLLALAAFVAVAGRSHAGDSLPARLTSLSEPAMVGLVFIAAFALSIASMAWLGAHSRPAEPEFEEDEDFDFSGLAVGVPAPSFHAEDLGGDTVTLESLRRPGLPTLLVFADPTCGSCSALLPDVARWQRELAGELTVAVVASGEPEAVQAEADLRGLADALVQRERDVSDAYRIAGTPAAVVVGADGRIAGETAEGADEIQHLMDRELWRRRLAPDG